MPHAASHQLPQGNTGASTSRTGLCFEPQSVSSKVNPPFLVLTALRSCAGTTAQGMTLPPHADSSQASWSRRPSGLVMGFLLGSGATAACTALYGSPLLGNPAPTESHQSPGSPGGTTSAPDPEQQLWDSISLERLLGGLSSAAMAVSSMRRSTAAQQSEAPPSIPRQAAPAPAAAAASASPLLGRHFIADAAAKAAPAVVNVTVDHTASRQPHGFGVFAAK